MSKKMVLLSLLVSTTVLTTSIKAEGLTVTNSSDVSTTQDTEVLTPSQDVEQLTPSDGSMNVVMEEPQTDTSTSATDMSNSDATISSSVSEVIVDTVEETTSTETEVIVPEEDVMVSKEEDVPDQVLATTQVMEETTVTMPSVVTDTTLEPINELTIDTVSATNSVPKVVPIAEPINEIVNVQSTEAKPVGTLTDLRQKPVGTLKALQVLPEASSTSSKSPIIIGVMTLLFGLIGLLHMYAKRIFG